LGLTAGDIDLFKQPILVRVVTSPITTEDLPKMSRHYNQSFAQEMDDIADGISAAKFISQETLEVFSKMMNDGNYGTIRQFLDSADAKKFVQRLIDDGVIEEKKFSKYLLGDDKKLTEGGKNFVESVLRGKFIDNYDILKQAPKNVINKIDKVINNLVAIKSSGAKWDLSAKMKDALKLCVGYREEKALSLRLTPEDFLNLVSEDLLSSMTNGKQQTHVNSVNQAKKDTVTRDLFLMLEKLGPNTVVAIIKSYAATAMSFPENMGSLIPAPDPVKTLHRLITDALGTKKGVHEAADMDSALYSAMDDIDDLIYRATSLEQLEVLFFSLFAKQKDSKSLYQRLVDGEFNLCKPMPFLSTLEKVFREIKKVDPLKDPLKNWINLHQDWIV
ncbi:MAG: hypothetical protein IJS50_05530, partial [Desulfovibrio sp.]|nr:hypothetical protein [Desulfovibrio sp.]